jgi:hypothetical protein
MQLHLRSLQTQLAIRLGAVILVATPLGVGAIVYEGMNAADALGDAQLARRAAEIAQYVAVGPDGTLCANDDETLIPCEFRLGHRRRHRGHAQQQWINQRGECCWY